MTKRIFTVVFLLLFFADCKSQKNVLDGVYTTPRPDDGVTLIVTILDANTKLPLDSVTLEVSGNDGSSLSLRTNSEGKLKCLLYPYRFVLVYEKEKYRTLREEIGFTHAPDTINLKKFLELK